MTEGHQKMGNMLTPTTALAVKLHYVKWAIHQKWWCHMVALSGGGRISGPPHAAHELCKFCLKPWKSLSTSQLYKLVNCNYHSSATLWPCNSAFSNTTTQPMAAPSLVGFQWACDDGGSFVIIIGALCSCMHPFKYFVKTFSDNVSDSFPIVASPDYRQTAQLLS